MNDKGFTLIEILAVMIIMGVILLIAVPSVSQSISQSRTSTYITEAKRFVEAARNLVETEQLKIISKDTTFYIPRECLPVEKGQESPFGTWKAVYVVVTYDGYEHYYYFTSTDSKKRGIRLIYADKLDNDKVETDVSTINTRIGVGGRTKIKQLKKDVCTLSDTTEVTATSFINEKE